MKKLYSLVLLSTIGCFNSNGYTDVTNMERNIFKIDDKDHICTESKKYNTTNNSSNSLNINEQLSNKIQHTSDLIESYSKKLIEVEQEDNKLSYIKEVMKDFNNKFKGDWSLLNNNLSIDDINQIKKMYNNNNPIQDLKDFITKESEKVNIINNIKSNLKLSIEELKEIKAVLQFSKDYSVIPNIVEFVKNNSDKLLKGQAVNFNSIFSPIKKQFNDAMSKSGIDTEIEHIKNQALFVYAAMSMCPELKTEHITGVYECKDIKTKSSKYDFVNGLRTEDGTIYGFAASGTYIITLDKQNYKIN